MVWSPVPCDRMRQDAFCSPLCLCEGVSAAVPYAWVREGMFYNLSCLSKGGCVLQSVVTDWARVCSAVSCSCVREGVFCSLMPEWGRVCSAVYWDRMKQDKTSTSRSYCRLSKSSLGHWTFLINQQTGKPQQSKFNASNRLLENKEAGAEIWALTDYWLILNVKDLNPL